MTIPSPSRTASRLPLFSIAAALLLGLTASGTAGALLSYTLASPLKKAGCAGDSDSDCLDNLEETNLTWAISPWYFYDEDEDCSGWTNKWGLPSFHFARLDYFQVRPQGANVGSWTSNGVAKWVAVTFFLNYPHDCGGIFLGVAGHQGDSESVRYYLYSYDLSPSYSRRFVARGRRCLEMQGIRPRRDEGVLTVRRGAKGPDNAADSGTYGLAAEAA
jgi:hypothetical protein